MTAIAKERDIINPFPSVGKRGPEVLLPKLKEEDWHNIADLEESRTYHFPTGEYTIKNPVKLHVKRKSDGDSHRLVDSRGVKHYIPSGWLAISFKGEYKY